MSGPHKGLMQRYSTEHVLLEKNAGAGSLIERMGMMLLNEGLIESNRRDDVRAREEHDQQYENKREQALEQVEVAAAPLRGTRVPPRKENRMAPWKEMDTPIWDGGSDEQYMTRLASVGVAMGNELAKLAGFKLPALKAMGQQALAAGKEMGAGALGAVKTVASNVPGAGAAGFVARHPVGTARAVIGAGVLGAGALGAKAINTGVRALGQEPAGPATFGGGRYGYQPANGINAYGQPQVGSQLY